MRKQHKTTAIVPPVAIQSAAAPAAAPPVRPNAEEAVRLRAYQRWEEAGKPSGDGVPFWLEAEKELIQPN